MGKLSLASTGVADLSILNHALSHKSIRIVDHYRVLLLLTLGPDPCNVSNAYCSLAPLS
jgi:hypothetical protein